MQFRKAAEGAVAWYATKYDECTLVATGKPYRFQEGSGRAAILNNWGQDGRKLGEVTRLAAEHGYDPNFTIGAIFRQHETVDGAWRIAPPEGKTLEEIKGQRKSRELTPEQRAAKEAKEAEKAAKAAARAEKQAEKERQRAAKEAEREAKAKEREAAKAAKEAEATAADPASDAPKKGKGRPRKASEPTTQVNANAEVAEQPAA